MSVQVHVLSEVLSYMLIKNLVHFRFKMEPLYLVVMTHVGRRMAYVALLNPVHVNSKLRQCTLSCPSVIKVVQRMMAYVVRF